MMTDTKRVADWISPALKERLLAAVKPINLNETTTQYHVGYQNAQRDFAFVLKHKANIEPEETE